MTLASDAPPYGHLSFLTSATGDAAIDADLDYITQLDWNSTSVGSIQTWPRELLVLINLAMLSPQPQLFLLGKDSIILYNTAYGRLLRDHHPMYQGRPIAMNTALIANSENIDRIVARADSRDALANENQVPFFFAHNGVLEEVLLSATMVKLPLSLQGFHATTYDTTETAVRQRRERAFSRIFRDVPAANDFGSVWSSLLSGLDAASDVIPFAIIYSAVSTIRQSEETGIIARHVDPERLQLEGVSGSFDELPPNQIYLDKCEQQTTWISSIKNAIVARQLVLLRIEDGTFPSSFRQASRARCYGHDCTAAVVMPSSLIHGSPVHGVLIIGIAPCRPYDQMYQSWMEACNLTLVNALATLAIAENNEFARETEQRLAARERELMAVELLHQKHETAIVAGKMRCMVQIMALSRVAEFECLTNGDVLNSNDAFHELYGDDQRDSSRGGVNFHAMCHREDIDALSKQWALLLERWTANFVVRLLDRSKSAKLVQVACVRIPEDARTGDRIVGCIIDISAQEIAKQESHRRAEAILQLHRSEARLFNFIETAPMGIMILDRLREITFFNKAWSRMSRVDVQSGKQLDIHSIVVPEDVSHFHRELDDLLKTGKPTQFELRLRNVTAISHSAIEGHAWIMVSAFPDIVDEQVHQIMVAITDINHFKLVESLQRTRLTEAVEAKKKQERFVDMTSHEIRNPLSAVIQCSDELDHSLAQMAQTLQQLTISGSVPDAVLALGKMHQDLSEAASTISSCTAHQKRIVDDLLSLSKLDADLLEICPQAFDLQSFLAQVIKVFSAKAERANVTMSVELDASIKTGAYEWIEADPGRLMQVLLNLVGNAIKFTANNASERVVSLSVGVVMAESMDLASSLGMTKLVPADHSTKVANADTDLCLWFSVRDTGCGMDEKSQQRIFNRFAQASPRTYSRYGGSGLGLYISRKLVNMQGGHFGFTSRPGQGSTFAFYVRAGRARPKLMTHRSSNEEVVSVPNPPGEVVASTEPPSVLVVEDNITNRRVLRRQLERKGYQVHTAENGEEALHFMRTSRNWIEGLEKGEDAPKIDVVLMDIEMPVMNGLQCANGIRAAEREGKLRPGLPIIAVTANARVEQLAAAIDAGMNDAISKPIDITSLLSAVTRLTSQPAP